MEELCESFVELDMESKYFVTVPYDTDDPDFTWHENIVSDSDEDDYSRPQSNSSLNDEKDISNCNRKRQKKTFKKCDEKAANVTPKPEDDVVNTSEIEMSTSFEIQTIKFPGRTKSPCTSTSDSDTGSSAKEFTKRHRKIVFSSSYNSKDDADFNAKCFTTFYPSSGETVRTVPSTCPKSTDTEPNYPVPTHISRARKRGQMNQEQSRVLGYADCGLKNTTFPSSSTSSYRLNQTFPLSSVSGEESCSYDFKTPHKKIKRSAKLNRKSVNSNEIMPCYRSYQLLGDSQLLRFSEQLLNYSSFVANAEYRSSRRLGYCVSGQKIKDLEQRILKNELKLWDKLIVLIGTNDMVYGTQLKSMCDSFDSMLKKLKRNAERIVILTVPPVPKLANDSKHILKLKRFNEFLMNCANNRNVFAVDLASLYISYSNTISEQFFEQVFYKTRTHSKVDLIHLNRNGFKLLRAILDIEYFDKYSNCR